MAASRSIALALGIGVLAGTFLVGCDEHAVEVGGVGEVVLDVHSLFHAAGGELCVSVVDSLVLTVTEADGSKQTLTRVLTPEETLVRIPVEVDAGTVTFDAEVRSNNGTLLYMGSASANVETDRFNVEVPIDAVDAVLKACPSLVPLVRSAAAPRGLLPFYLGELRVINRGVRAAAWEALFETPFCDNEPCFRLDPGASTVLAGDTVSISGIASLTTLADGFDVRIVAAVGTLDVRFELGILRPAAQPDIVTVLEGGLTEVDVLANDIDPEGGLLTLVSVGSARYGTAEKEGDFVLYRADYTPVWGVTSEDRFTYIVDAGGLDAGGRRAEGEANVRVDPCIAFDKPITSRTVDTPFYTENGIPISTRTLAVGNDQGRFVEAAIAPIFDSNNDLGAYLTDAALEFDWSQRPVQYIRFDFVDNAATINFAINAGERYIGSSLTSEIPVPQGITVSVDDGKFGPETRLVIEAEAATPIEQLLLGGGGETLILDDVCFGFAPPDNN